MPKNGDLLNKEYASSLKHRYVGKTTRTCKVYGLPAWPDAAPGECTDNKLSYGLILRVRRGYHYRVNEYQP